MNIYHINRLSLINSVGANGCIEFSDILGAAYQLVGSSLRVSHYTYRRFYASVNFNGSEYELYFDHSDWPRYRALPNVRCINSQCHQLDSFPEYIQRVLLLSVASSNENQSLRCIAPRLYSEIKNKHPNVNLMFNSIEMTYKEVALDELVPMYVSQEHNLYFTIGDRKAFRFSEQLDLMWELELGDNVTMSNKPFYKFGHFECDPVAIDNYFVLNREANHVDRMKNVVLRDADTGEPEDREIPDHYREKGRLVGLDIEKPKLLWERVFDYQVDDIAPVMGDRVLVTSERYLFILNPATGEVEREWDSGIRDSDKVETGSNTLLSVGDTVFLFSYLDRRIQIYDAKTMTLQRTIDGNDAGYAFGAGRTRVYGKRVLVPVDLVYQPFGGGAFLVIDLDNLDAELEVEQGPELHITEPTPENPGPIVCEVDYPDWGKALRFAERELVNRVVFKSGIDERKYYKPRVVKLIYSGYEADKALVQEKLEIFKQRFEKMIDDPLVPGIALPPVTVEYELA